MVEIAVSLLDVDEEDAISYFYNIETAKIDYFHIDVMDGKFVENENVEKMKDYALKVHTISMTPIDVHLMVQNPKEYFDYFIDQGADRISFHIEACRDKDEALGYIRYLVENGVKASIAVNPDTSLDGIYDLLPNLHMVLIMSVVPGKGGQKFIPSIDKKIDELRNYCEDNNIDIDIEVDGGINNITCKDAIDNGATILVAGNYILSSDDYAKAVNDLKEEYIEREGE